MKDNNNTSPHILNTSATLIGFCFIVLTSLKISHLKEGTFIDELTAIGIVMFMISCIFSFLSMRSNGERAYRYEKIADIIFLTGLFMLFSITMMITFNIIA